MPPKIDRKPVQSSNLSSVGYDAAARVLEVEFKSGAVWRYTGVPAEVHRELMAAASVGSFFARNVRSSFAGAPVEAPRAAE